MSERNTPTSVTLAPELKLDAQEHALAMSRAAKGKRTHDVKDVIRQALSFYLVTHVPGCISCREGMSCAKVQAANERYATQAELKEDSEPWKLAKDAYTKAFNAANPGECAPFTAVEAKALKTLFKTQNGFAGVVYLIEKAWSHSYWKGKMTLAMLAANPARVLTSDGTPIPQSPRTSKQIGNFMPEIEER
jgi:hypothetical protein